MLSFNPIQVYLSSAGQDPSCFWTELKYNQKAEGFAFQELCLAMWGIWDPVTFFSGEISQEE